MSRKDTLMGDSTAVKETSVSWDGDFDAERAQTLVTNLRAEVKELKGKLATATVEANKVTELEAQVNQLTESLQEREGELKAVEMKSKKLKILSDRGLPEALEKALVGDTEEEWTEMADTLSALITKDENKGEAEGGFVPDPVQSAKGAGLSEEAQRLQLAKQVFGSL